MKFSDMPYKRPDIEVAIQTQEALTDKLLAAPDFAAAEAVFFEVQTFAEDLETRYVLAYVRHEMDTTDPFYDGEIAFLDEWMPLLEEPCQRWEKALLASPFRPDFERKYGTLLFEDMELRMKGFDPAIVPELQEENRLCTEYAKVIASAQIPFEGEVYTLSQLTPKKEAPEDDRRLAAWQAEGGFYRKNGAKLDELYDKLTAVRDRMAKKLGYPDYRPLGYCRMQRNDYGPEEVARFREAVRQHLVPVAEKIYRSQAQRLGVPYPMSFADAALSFRSGNAKPWGTAEDILAQGREFYHELAPETADFIDEMYRRELLDVLSRKGKAGGGFCVDLPAHKAQFIFANFNGTAGDVEVITHEAGHAFAGWTCRDMEPAEYRQPTLESCEIHSMTMEFFAWPWAEGFFGADADKFCFNHLAGALTFLPYGVLVDHFQHEVYEHPDMTPAERHDTWRGLLSEYMPWLRLEEDIPFYGEGKGWQRQSHIYERPFYYIDYCLAQTVALQFWAVMQEDRADAWRRYMALVGLGGSRKFTELVAAAGLESPFGGEALKTVARAAEQWLEEMLPKVK